MKTNCKIDITDDNYHFIRECAKVWGITFDEAINRLIKYSAHVMAESNDIALGSDEYKNILSL